MINMYMYYLNLHYLLHTLAMLLVSLDLNIIYVLVYGIFMHKYVYVSV